MRKPIVAIVFAIAFAAVLGLAGCGGSSSSAASASAESASASSSAEDQAKAEYDNAVALFNEGKFYSAKEAFEKSAYDDWEKRAAECVQPMPETSELFHDEGLVSDDMFLIFDVNQTDSAQGMYISVYTKDKKLASTLFVKGSGTIETHLPGGEYYIDDSSGTEWYGEDEQFGPDGHYESMVFEEAEGDRYLTVLDSGYQWTISINTSSGDGQNVGSEETGWANRSQGASGK